MTYQRGIIILLLLLFIVIMDLIIISSIPSLRLFLNLSLLTVIGLTIGENLWIGLGAAILVGVIYSQFSVLSGPVYIISFMTASIACWLFSRKIVSSHSRISFISTVIVGTAGYSLVLVLIVLLVTLFDRQRIHLDIVTIIISGFIQIFIHPIILGLLWRLVDRHQYHHISNMSTSSF